MLLKHFLNNLAALGSPAFHYFKALTFHLCFTFPTISLKTKNYQLSTQKGILFTLIREMLAQV